MLGILLTAIGAGLHFWTTRILISANKDTPLPMIFGRVRNTPRRPASFYALLLVGFSLLVWGAAWATQSIGDWTALAVVLFMAPSLIVWLRHNRRVARR